MKRTVLIPLLLSTILLVGCETETEFDRCFETNTSVFDFDSYLNKYESIAIDDDNRFYKIQDRLSPIEKAYEICAATDPINRDEICEANVNKAYKNEAIKVCHSQGVY